MERILKEFNYLGKFWYPEQEETKFLGKVGFKGTEIELILYNAPENNFVPVIHGLLFDEAREITIFKNYLKNYYNFGNQVTGANTQQALYIAEYIFLGALYQEDNLFSVFKIEFNNIQKWINWSPYSSFYDQENEQQIYRFNQNTILISTEIEDLNCTIEVYPTSQIMRSTSIFEFQHNFIFELKFNQSVSYTEFIVILNHLKSLIKFLTHADVSIDTVKTILNNRKVEIYYLTSSQVKYPIRLEDYLVSWDEVINDSQIFNRWFSLYRKYEHLFNHYFSLLFNSNIYIDMQLLALTQALEFYYRTKYTEEEQNYLTQENHTELINSIFQDLPHQIPEETEYDNFKASFNNKLKFSNERSLRNKIKKILQDNWGNFESFIEHRNTFIEQVVHTRNFLTHLSDDTSEFILTDFSDKLKLVEKLKVIIAAVLFVELGIPLAIPRLSNRSFS